MFISLIIIQNINVNNAPRRLKLNNNLRTRRREIANRAATFMNGDDQRTTNLALFGLGENASNANIRKAHRKEALKLHPDKHASKSEPEKAELKTRFIAMEAAYKRLDPGHAMANTPPGTPPGTGNASVSSATPAGVGLGSS
jgi:hypothetical protein